MRARWYFMIFVYALMACHDKLETDNFDAIRTSSEDNISSPWAEWEALCKRLPKNGYDSANVWEKNFSRNNIRDPERYVIYNTAPIVRSAVDLRDPYIYRYTDSLFTTKILAKIEKEQRIESSPIKNMDSLSIIIHKKISSTSFPPIEDQIWDYFNYKLLINKSISPHSYTLNSDLPAIHSKKINEIYKGIYKDSANAYQIALEYGENISNDQHQTSFLFKLLILNVNHHTAFNAISEKLLAICEQSSEISNREKARWILGLTKLTISYYGWSSFSFEDSFSEFGESQKILKLFNLAEGYASISEIDINYLFKIRWIQYLYYVEMNGIWEDPYLEIVHDKLSETDGDWNSPFWEHTERWEYTKRGLNSLKYELRKIYGILQKGERTDYRMFLDIVSQLYCRHLESKYAVHSERDELDVSILLTLSECQRYMLNLPAALHCLYAALEIQLTSKNTTLAFQSPRTLRLIEFLLRDMEIYRMESELNLTFTDYERIEYPVTDFTDSFIFQIPRDSRLWTNAHYDTLKRKLSTDTLDCGCPMDVNQIDKAFQLYTDHSLKDVLWKIGLHEVLYGNKNRAYLLIAKSESILIPRFSAKDPPTILRDVGVNSTLARSYIDKNKLDKGNYRILILFISLITLILIIGLIAHLWKKAISKKKLAELLEAKERIHAKTMSQLAHLAPDIQLNLGSKIEAYSQKLENLVKNQWEALNIDALNEIWSKEKLISKDLVVLSKRLRQIFLKVPDAPSQFQSETELVLELMNIRYRDDLASASNLTKIQKSSFGNIALPPFIIFNLVANAYKHGQITQRDEGGNYGTLKIDAESNKENFWKVTFENDCPPPPNKDTIGSGLAFVAFILREWNGKEIPPEFKFGYVLQRNHKWKYIVTFNLRNETYSDTFG